MDLLGKLQEKGKKLFVTTNHHVEWMELALETTLGPDWQEFFDICLANCRMPLFGNTESKFRAYEERERGDAYDSVQDMKESGDKIFLEGNAAALKDYFT